MTIDNRKVDPRIKCLKIELQIKKNHFWIINPHLKIYSHQSNPR